MTTYTLPDLPYAYDALEPHYSAEALQLHHDGHHRAYVTKANALTEQLATAAPADVNAAKLRSLAFNVAGHHLHSLFWHCMTPNAEPRPHGALADAMNRSFGDHDRFKELVAAAGASIEGSGWVTLTWEPTAEKLQLSTVHDHHAYLIPDSVTIMVLDLWEHAYYVDHRNKKADWIKAFWNIADWESIGARFEDIRQVATALA
jgi:Fe-Mn family superoxide dismutase